MRRGCRAWPLTVALALLALTATNAAKGDDKIDCITAFDDAQRLRDEGKFVNARGRALVCVRNACPAVLRADCATWLANIEASLPTVTLSATDREGHDLSAVDVEVDGVLRTEALEGKAIAVDPGPHVFRFVAKDRPPSEVRVILHQGERNRQVSAVLDAAAGAAVPMASATSEPGPTSSSRPVLMTGYITAGAGLLLLGGASYAWISGSNALSDLRSSCGKTSTCSQGQVDDVRNRYIIGDTAGPLGGIAVALGAYLVLFGSHRSTTAAGPTPMVMVDALHGGASVGISGTF